MPAKVAPVFADAGRVLLHHAADYAARDGRRADSAGAMNAAERPPVLMMEQCTATVTATPS